MPLCLFFSKSHAINFYKVGINFGDGNLKFRLNEITSWQLIPWWYLVLTHIMLNLFLGNLKIYLHFLSNVNRKMAQVNEILPLGGQGPVYQYRGCWWLGNTQVPVHQPWYWPSYSRIFHFQHQNGNPFPPSAAYMRQWTGSALIQVMACCLYGTKPLPEPMLPFCQLDSWEKISVKFESRFYHFRSRKCTWKCCLPKWQPFCSEGD